MRFPSMTRDMKKFGAVPFSGQGVVDIAYTCDGLSLRNYFLYGEPPFDVNRVKEWLK